MAEFYPCWVCKKYFNPGTTNWCYHVATVSDFGTHKAHVDCAHEYDRKMAVIRTERDAEAKAKHESRWRWFRQLMGGHNGQF